jgi:ABC-type transport system involved in cytochrome c biogenesis permease subunit
MAIVGFAVVLFTFFGVNFLLTGHHGEFTRF